MNNITIKDSCCIFYVKGCLKHTRPGTHQTPLEIPAYPQDTNICIKAVLSKYLEMSKDKRGQESGLLITFQKPFKAVTVDTLSRWVKATMSQAGIDIDRFKPNSGHAASPSAAKAANVPVTHLGQFERSILDTKF